MEDRSAHFLRALLVIVTLALSTPLAAGVSIVGVRWPGHPAVVLVVICTELEQDPYDLKQCRSRPTHPLKPLNATLTDLFNKAAKEWKDQLEEHIYFKSTPVYVKGAVLVGQSEDPTQCFTTFVGNGPERTIVLSLGTACYDKATPLGTALHELGHVVGLHHEQRRADRDQYFTVDAATMSAAAAACKSDRDCLSYYQQWHRFCPKPPANCELDFRDPTSSTSPFSKENADSHGPYDLGSLMHYPIMPYHYGNHPIMVVGLKPPSIDWLASHGLTETAIGQRKKLSPGDIAAIKEMYPKHQ